MKKGIFAITPLILLGLLLFYFTRGGTLTMLRENVPLNPKLVVERINLKDNEITLYILNDGQHPVTLSQVMVNGAFWEYSIEPESTIGRLKRGKIKIPYPWVQGEAQEILIITDEGVTFEARIEAAVESPVPDGQYLGFLSLIGTYVGVIPVFLGLLWLPFLKSIKGGWFSFILSMTIGLLTFLGIDALNEAIQIAKKTPESLKGIGILTIGFLFSFLALSVIGRAGNESSEKRAGSQKNLILAFSIAFGIGIHNMGEGLAIGGAYAVGEISLGTLLIIGFMIHNITEGVAIVAPISKESPSIKNITLLGLIAGAPTIIGTWVGGFAYSATWAVLFLAIGSGAIFQVVYEIARQMSRGSIEALFSIKNLTGFMAGLLIMYGTGLFVSA